MKKKAKKDMHPGNSETPKPLAGVEPQAKIKAIIPQGPTALLATQDILILKDLLGSFSEQTGAFFG